MSKAESAATAASNAQNTANAAAGSSTNYIKNGGPNGTSNPIVGWTVSGNVYKHTFPGGQNHVDLGYTTLAHPIFVGRKYRLSLDARVTSGTFSSSDYFNFGLSNGWESIKAQALTSSWKTYSGVVTSSKEATQVFMSSYVGSSGSKAVEMRNVSMTDVTETYDAATNAQSTANTANSNAQNAQNRVGNLETCIKMTSDGVRVGKISNGNFTGYSALVNSAGSFDILGSNSKNVVSFGPTATRFYDLNGNAKLAMLYNPSSSLYQVGTVSSNSAASIDSGFTVDGQWLKLESVNRNIEISAANGRILLKPSGDHDNQQNGISFYSGVRFENDGTALRHIYRGSLVANPNGANGLTITRARQHMNGDVCVAINGDWQANRLVVMGCDYDNGYYSVRLYNWGGSFNRSVRIDWCVFEVDEFTPK